MVVTDDKLFRISVSPASIAEVPALKQCSHETSVVILPTTRIGRGKTIKNMKIKLDESRLYAR